jgi:hypothetical protein
LQPNPCRAIPKLVGRSFVLKVNDDVAVAGFGVAVVHLGFVEAAGDIGAAGVLDDLLCFW